MMNQRHWLLFLVVLLGLIGLACNAAGEPDTITPILALPTAVTQTATPDDAINTPTGTAVSATPTTCTLNARFVSDVTIPDNTEIEPGAEFIKTWRMENNGNCAWKSATTWRFVSGEQMGGINAIPVNPALPGETVDLSITLTAPAAPGAYTGHWQLHTPEGQPFGRRVFARIIVPGAPTPSPTATATPTAAPATPAAPSKPVIQYFRAVPDLADPGDAIRLEWFVYEADVVTIYHLEAGGPLGEPHWNVDAAGALTTTIPASRRNSDSFALFAENVAGTSQAAVTITLTCPDEWFFSPAPDECPASPPLFSDAAEQPFENGRMIWVKEMDAIIVLFADGNSPHWRIYTDNWDEGDLIDDPTITPPSGWYQPVRGFGLLWREETGIRDRLGWATELETAFGAAVQRNSPPKYPTIYVGALGGGVWQLLPEGSGWEKLP